MSREADWERLARYVSGECSEREAARVRAWLSSDPSLEERIARLRQVWQITGVPLSDWDDDAAWERLRRRVEEEANAPSATPGSVPERDRPPRRLPSSRRRARRFSAYRPAVAAAVAVAVVAVLAVLLMRGARLSGEDSGSPTFTTANGQRAIIELTDGTQVHLNANSRLTLSAGFAAGRRDVDLEGEAYFEVARDPIRPFVVHTEEADVRVLGTAFNVQAYEKGAVQVAVAEGEVALRVERPDAPGRDTAVVLHRRQLGVVSGKDLRAVRQGVDLSRYLAWTEGRLVFKDTPFDEVVTRLERWYDLEIDVAVPFGAVVALNAAFDDEALNVVLSDIAVALNLQYEKEGRAVTFYRRSSARSSPAQHAFPAR